MSSSDNPDPDPQAEAERDATETATAVPEVSQDQSPNQTTPTQLRPRAIEQPERRWLLFKGTGVGDALQATTLVGAMSYAYSWYAITVIFSRFGLTAEDAGYGFSALLVRVTPVMGLTLAIGLVLVVFSRIIDRSVGEFVGGILEDRPTRGGRVMVFGLVLVGQTALLNLLSRSLPGGGETRFALAVGATLLIGAVPGSFIFIGTEWSDRHTIPTFWRDVPFMGLALSAICCLLITSLKLPDWRIRIAIALAACILLIVVMTTRKKGHLGWLLIFTGAFGGAMLIGERAWSIPGCVLIAWALPSFLVVVDSDELSLRLNRTSNSAQALVVERNVRRLGTLVGALVVIALAIGGPVYVADRVERSVRQGRPVAMPHRSVPLLTIRRAKLTQPPGLAPEASCVLVLGHDDALLSVLVPETDQVLRLPLETSVLAEPCQ